MIEIGDYITRNSYNNDTVFKVINRKADTLYLKGVDYRIYADANVNDCIIVDKDSLKDDFYPKLVDCCDRSEYFYLPGKILHLDGDSEYLKRCMKFYKDNNVFAIGKKIDEKTLSKEIYNLLVEYNPDILIITGHDSINKDKDINNMKNYKNSINFVNGVYQAWKFEKSHEKLVVIAGACQSNYEALIKAGANFASSPKRVNIHALDPAIIAINIALTEKNKDINLIELLSKTKYGESGMGGLKSTGMMYVGYPR